MAETTKTTVVQRLGHVLGWTGNLIGGLLLIAGVYALTLPGGDTIAKVVFLLIPGLLIFLLGRALRYILTGPAR
jgi:hypothetical protein